MGHEALNEVPPLSLIREVYVQQTLITQLTESLLTFVWHLPILRVPLT